MDARRISVFGGTGRTGRIVVDGALERGWDVTAFAHAPPSDPLNGRVTVVTGDARDDDKVREALHDATDVISVMGIREGEEPTTELSDATRTIVDRMRREGPRRLALTVNSSVFHDRPVPPPFGIVADEHRRNVALLRSLPEGDLDWTVLAPSFLTDDPPADAYRSALDQKAPGKGIPRPDLATAVLDALDRGEWIRHVVGVSA